MTAEIIDCSWHVIIVLKIFGSRVVYVVITHVNMKLREIIRNIDE